MPATYEVDFLIITTLRVETEAVEELLQDRDSLTHDVVGIISRESSASNYVVGVTEIGMMGTNAAQAAAREALGRLNPKRVILAGIAAGFPEDGVKFGDVLAPYWIVPYELAKLKERSRGKRWFGLETRRRLFERGKATVEVEHRTNPIPVSHRLWHAANTLGRDGKSDWWCAIKESRPDSSEITPEVHSKSTSKLGSGDKIVATEFAEVREWLRAQGAMGLEMESFGVLTACRMMDTPFLVVKASQDPATVIKDIRSEKDLWRVYAAQAAAAFTVALIRRFELHDSAFVADHRRAVTRIAELFERDAPKPQFTYTVSRASSYELLREGVYDSSLEDPHVLIPNDAAPEVVLHGGGGTGKTRIVRSLLVSLIDTGLCPVLLDLRRYSIGGKHVQEAENIDRLVGDITLICSIPRRSPSELERLAKETTLAVLIDGLNEVSREARTALVDYFRTLHRTDTCYLLVTDRLGSPESLATFSHAVVDRLDIVTVESVFDGTFGKDSFGELKDRLQRIYRRPFFLSLAVKHKRKFAGQSVWSGIFREFFLTQLRMEVTELERIGEASFKAISRDGSFAVATFKHAVNGRIHQSLIEAEVLASDEGGFEHHLWRDYLASRHLATLNEWGDTVFDAVTTFASSLESLSLTVEQLVDRSLKDKFLNAVYDWNYIAAADCIRDFSDDDPEPRQVNLSIRSAILAGIGEKRFDKMERTRQRAENILRQHRYEFARGFIEAKTEDALRRHVAKLDGAEVWFKEWKTLFTRQTGESLTGKEIELIASDDSLTGWTAANLARRSRVTEEEQKQIKEIYIRLRSDDKKKSVRWRVVHVLGACPNTENVEFLLATATSDTYHWVKYGAVRALVEIASASEEHLRGEVLRGLREFIRDFDPGNVWIQRHVMQEIVEAAFIKNSQPGWKDAVLPILTLAAERVDLSYQTQLKKRISDFCL